MVYQVTCFVRPPVQKCCSQPKAALWSTNLTKRMLPSTAVNNCFISLILTLSYLSILLQIFRDIIEQYKTPIPVSKQFKLNANVVVCISNHGQCWYKHNAFLTLHYRTFSTMLGTGIDNCLTKSTDTVIAYEAVWFRQDYSVLWNYCKSARFFVFTTCKYALSSAQKPLRIESVVA